MFGVVVYVFEFDFGFVGLRVLAFDVLVAFLFLFLGEMKGVCVVYV